MLPESKVIIWNGKHYRPGAPGYDGVLFMVETQKKDAEIERQKVKDITDILKSNKQLIEKDHKRKPKGGPRKGKKNVKRGSRLSEMEKETKGYATLTNTAIAKELKKLPKYTKLSNITLERDVATLRKEGKIK